MSGCIDIGDYELVSELGKGSFGAVYKAKNKDEHVFAVKVLTPGRDTKNYSLVVSEIGIHRALESHPNVVKFVDWFNHSDKLHLVMEYCELGSLHAYLRDGLPEVNTAKSFMTDMARGLNHLHRNGIIHRDIKPENVLLVVTESGRTACKISDFGLSVQSTTDTTNIPEDQRGSIVGSVYHQTFVGTRPYIAPEVWTSHYTKRCDVFSLGLVFFALFCPTTSNSPLVAGHKFFARMQKLEIEKNVNGCVENVRVAKLIISMLERDPHQRISAYAVEEGLVEMAVPDEEVFFVGITFLLLLTVFLLVPYKLFLSFFSLAILISIEFRVFPKSVGTLSF